MQIGLGVRAGNGAAGVKKAPRSFRGSAWRGRCAAAVGRRARKSEKATCLVHGVGKAGQGAVARDEIEQIAMLAGRGIGPFAGGAGTAIGALQPHVKTRSEERRV